MMEDDLLLDDEPQDTPTPTPTPTPKALTVADFPTPSEIAALQLTKTFSTPQKLTMSSWASEVTAVSRMAASVGAYKDSLSGYEMVGRHIGAITDAPQNHLHVHNPNANQSAIDLDPALLREQTVEDLEARLRAIRTRVAEDTDADVNPPADDELLQ